MSRCQHCNKLTHSEDLYVEFELDDYDKVDELRSLKDFMEPYNYASSLKSQCEIGKLKCGDIWIHFMAKDKKGDQEPIETKINNETPIGLPKCCGTFMTPVFGKNKDGYFCDTCGNYIERK